MDPVLIAILGLVIGLALLAIEFFIPSGGLIFVIACVSLTVGVWGAWGAWGADHRPWFWTYVGSLVFLIPGSVAGGLYALNNSKFGNNVLLKPPSPDEVDGFERESDKMRQLIGQRGEALGLLNPGGMVIVDGNRYHCETLGMMIDPKTKVEVIEVNGNRLVVRVPFESKTSQDTPSTSPQVVESSTTEDAGSFDFDVPEDS